MSNLCRRFRTTFDAVRTKVLIRLAVDAVAEGRQVTGLRTRSAIGPGNRRGAGRNPVVFAIRARWRRTSVEENRNARETTSKDGVFVSRIESQMSSRAGAQRI